MSYDSRPDTYKHIAAVRGLLLGVVENLLRRANRHDQSKLTEPELAVFDEYTPLLEKVEYGSPEYQDALAQMREKGLEHHYALNDHHPEHFVLDLVDAQVNPASRTDRAPFSGIDAMDLLQLTEMLCDWAAANRRMKDWAPEHAAQRLRGSIEFNQGRYGYSDEIKQLLLNSVEPILQADLNS